MPVRPSLAAGACLRLGAVLALSGCFRDRGFADNDDTTSTSSTSSSTTTTTTSPTSSTTTTGVTPISSTSDTTEPSSTSDTDTDPDTTGCLERLWYLDEDSDGYGLEQQSLMACEQPPGYAPLAGDCNPTVDTIYPGQLEVCDMVDNDCDLGVDEFSATNTACGGCRAVLSDPRVYYLCSALRDWAAARLACQAYGGGTDLVVLHSDAEQDLLVAEINTVPAEAAGAWWLGLGDAALEATFVWVDGTPLDFTAWGVNEPNNFMGGEDCAQFAIGLPGQWNDLACTTPMFYICEGPL
jgi:hypothetical protein